MNHYFSDNRHLENNRKEISFRFWCFNYTFITDNGVFSKDSVDFGTKVMLSVLKDANLGKNILDLGCGYGVIGITLKKQLQDANMVMVDVNPRAVELTKENAIKNEVVVDVRESFAFEHVLETNFHDIITNPPIRAGKKVIYCFFEEAYEHLIEDGNLWVVIRKAQGALSAKEKIASVFGNCEILLKDKGYFILRAQKK